MLIKNRSFYGDSNAPELKYIEFYDLSKQKLLKEIKTDIGKDVSISTSTLFVPIPGTTNYYSIIGRRYYEIKLSEYSFEDVTEKVFGRNKAFASGVASLEFAGHGFICVMTNEGKTVYYDPQANLAYSEEAANMVINDKISSGKEYEKTLYVFTDKSYSYPDEKIQLIQAVCTFRQGEAESIDDEPSWYSGDNGQKELFRSDNVKSFKDLTPGRLYFKPEVLYQDDKAILIKYRPIAAEDASMNLQLLNTSGKVIWTHELEEDFSRQGVVKADDGYWLQKTDSEYIHVSSGGETFETVNLDKDKN